MKCTCCEKEITGESVEKFRIKLCVDCSVKVLDKLNLVESVLERTVNKIRKEES